MQWNETLSHNTTRRQRYVIFKQMEMAARFHPVAMGQNNSSRLAVKMEMFGGNGSALGVTLRINR